MLLTLPNSLNAIIPTGNLVVTVSNLRNPPTVATQSLTLGV